MSPKMPHEFQNNRTSLGGKLEGESQLSQAPELGEPPPSDLPGARALEDVRCDDIMRWIIEDDVDNSISQLGRLFGNANEESRAFKITTSSEIAEFNRKGESLMNELVAVGTFDDKDLDLRLIEEDIVLFNEIGLENMVHRKTSALRKSNIEKIKEVGKEYEHIDTLTDLLENGVRSLMKDSFVPNGSSKAYRQSKSYVQNRALCNKHIFKLRSQGRAIILPCENIPGELMELIHRNTLILAPSSNPNREGRCCLNGSYEVRSRSSVGFQSLNDGIDIEASDEFYVPTRLPTLSDLCDRCQEARERAQRSGERICGAIIDVADAYRQVTLTYEAVLHRTVVIYIGDEMKPHIVFILVNNFGESRAGHIYNMAGLYVDFAHEKAMGYKCSDTYIDDTAMIDIESRIDDAMLECKKPITDMFEEGGIKDEKCKKWIEKLIALGWEFDLSPEVWRVAPKERGRIKLYMSLFMLLPVDIDRAKSEKLVTVKTLQCLASLLSWYSAVFRIAKPFTNAIWRNVGFGRPDNMKVLLSESCVRDIKFWRMIIMAAMKEPHFFSARISQLVSRPEVDLVMYTDASTSTGAGAWFTDQYNEKKECWIRWHPDETAAIQKSKSEGGISINELEFIAVMYAIIFWGHALHGKVIQVKCDNTTAISWIMKSRGSNRSPIAEYLVQVFVLYCLMTDIVVVADHIPGVMNTHADFLSRDMLLQEEYENEATSKEETISNELRRKTTLRETLKKSMVLQQNTHLQHQLNLVKSLL